MKNKSQDLGAAVFGIWFGLAGVAVGLAIYGSETGANITLPVTVALVIGMLTTIILYAMPYWAEAREAQAKGKRQSGDRIASLLEIMDDDERAAFKAALAQRALDDMGAPSDGELPAAEQTLAELLGKDGVARRQRN